MNTGRKVFTGSLNDTPPGKLDPIGLPRILETEKCILQRDGFVFI
jgi:hypothetical protein